MRFLTLFLFLFLCVIRISWAIDLQPGETAAPVNSFDYIQTTFLISSQSDYYSKGVKSPTDANKDTTTLSLRYGRIFNTDSMPMAFYVQTPVSNIRTSGSINASNFPPLNNSSGIGDTAIAFGFWPYVDREKKTYLGFAGYLILPTGNYENTKYINVGSNMYQTALQVGYQKEIYKNIDWSAALDSVFYQKNNDYLGSHKLELDNLYTFQTALTYNIENKYALSAGYFYTAGANPIVDGQDQNKPTNLQRYQISATGKYSFGKLVLQYGSDFKTENGFKEDGRLILRWVMPF
jgi:hypothetical protein